MLFLGLLKEISQIEKGVFDVFDLVLCKIPLCQNNLASLDEGLDLGSVDALPRLKYVGFGGNEMLSSITRVLPSWVLLYAPVPETAPSLFSCELFSSFHVRTALKLLPTARLSRGTCVLLEKELRRIVAHVFSRFIPRLKPWVFSVLLYKGRFLSSANRFKN